MAGYKNCRSAKTAEEYLLKCLFAAEEERDKALAYCEEVRAAEEERIEQAELKKKNSKRNLKMHLFLRSKRLKQFALK